MSRVLVVDDSRTAIEASSMILEHHAHQVITARSGREGVQRAAVDDPDVILLDIDMPGMDGLEALRELRARPATRDIPIIMVTVKNDPESMISSYQVGCNDFIVKPLDGNELIAKIRSLVDE